jgi:hypothetical protein
MQRSAPCNKNIGGAGVANATKCLQLAWHWSCGCNEVPRIFFGVGGGSNKDKWLGSCECNDEPRQSEDFGQHLNSIS